jgi:hypothetical protein
MAKNQAKKKSKRPRVGRDSESHTSFARVLAAIGLALVAGFAEGLGKGFTEEITEELVLQKHKAQEHQPNVREPDPTRGRIGSRPIVRDYSLTLLTGGEIEGRHTVSMSHTDLTETVPRYPLSGNVMDSSSILFISEPRSSSSPISVSVSKDEVLKYVSKHLELTPSMKDRLFRITEVRIEANQKKTDPSKE